MLSFPPASSVILCQFSENDIVMFVFSSIKKDQLTFHSLKEESSIVFLINVVCQQFPHLSPVESCSIVDGSRVVVGFS